MTRTWKEEHLRIKKLASALYKAGVRPGKLVDMRVCCVSCVSCAICIHVCTASCTAPSNPYDHNNHRKTGDTVSVMALNTPPMLELHFAVPGVRAVLNTLNTRCVVASCCVSDTRTLIPYASRTCPYNMYIYLRLDPPIIAFQLKHGDCKVLISDTEHSDTVEAALQILDQEGIKRWVAWGWLV